ncbi:MAG: aminodeoxychorismate lyase, partial [Lachnospiraceae bacterium]|nr:aminodeoxychorismate lyase [Lachnospiraceae bacterium]
MSAKKKVVNQVSSMVIHVAMAVILLTVAAMVFYVGIKKAYAFGYDIFNDQPMAEAPGTDKLFVVEKGMSRTQ